MNKCNTLLRTAMTSLVAMGAASYGSSVLAADAHAGEEQCAGVVKAGKNDCATATNACHGHVKKDADPMAWIYVPKGTCDRIVGARVVKVVDPTPAKS
jgi:uncharacterized membrane protein